MESSTRFIFRLWRWSAYRNKLHSLGQKDLWRQRYTCLQRYSWCEL